MEDENVIIEENVFEDDVTVNRTLEDSEGLIPKKNPSKKNNKRKRSETGINIRPYAMPCTALARSYMH
jgi:hypothetical protein